MGGSLAINMLVADSCLHLTLVAMIVLQTYRVCFTLLLDFQSKIQSKPPIRNHHLLELNLLPEAPFSTPKSFMNLLQNYPLLAKKLFFLLHLYPVLKQRFHLAVHVPFTLFSDGQLPFRFFKVFTVLLHPNL